MGLFFPSGLVFLLTTLCCYEILTLELAGTVSAFQPLAFSWTGYRSVNKDTTSITTRRRRRSRCDRKWTTSSALSIESRSDGDHDDKITDSLSIRSSFRNMSVVLCSNADVMLPGETRSLSIQRPPKNTLFRDEENEGERFLAVGYTYDGKNIEVIQDDSDDEDSHDEEEFNIMHIGTLCRVCQKDTLREEFTITLRLQAIGRIRLCHFVQQLDESWYQFDCDILKDEDEGCIDTGNNNSSEGHNAMSNFQKACMLVENIEILLHKLSHTVQQCTDDEDGDLWEHYQRALQQFGTNNAQSTTNDKFSDNSSFDTEQKKHYIESVSWATFTAIKQYEMKATRTSNIREESIDALLDSCSYRIRALDWYNLLERLKLAQYMLREMELRIQGRKLLDKGSSFTTESTSSTDGDDGDDSNARSMNGPPVNSTIFEDYDSFQ